MAPRQRAVVLHRVVDIVLRLIREKQGPRQFVGSFGLSRGTACLVVKDASERYGRIAGWTGGKAAGQTPTTNLDRTAARGLDGAPAVAGAGPDQLPMRIEIADPITLFAPLFCWAVTEMFRDWLNEPAIELL